MVVVVTPAAKKPQGPRNKYTRPDKRAPPTAAQLAQRRQKRQHENKRIAEVGAEQDQQIAELAVELDRPLPWVRMMFNCQAKIGKGTRKHNPYNAYLSKISDEYTGSATGREKLKQLSALAKAGYAKLTAAERAALLTEYAAKQRDKENVRHHWAHAQDADLRQNVKAISQRATGLANRTDSAFFMFFGNQNTSAYSTSMHALTPGAVSFINNVLKTTPEKLAMDFHSYLVSGRVDEPAESMAANVGKLKTRARELVAASFREVVPKGRMTYSLLGMFDRFKVDFQGGAEDILPDPGLMGTAPPLQQLINAIEAGTCGWRAVPEDEIDDRRADIIARLTAAKKKTTKEPRKERSDKKVARKPLEPLPTA